MIHNNQNFSRKLDIYYTANRLRDRSIVFSSIKPKSDDQLFVDLYNCTSCRRQIVSILICKTGRTILGSQIVQNQQRISCQLLAQLKILWICLVLLCL